jgi:Na+-transporting methylmalonyl-CoA/oxaloacetate decarboxylase gamma subunit
MWEEAIKVAIIGFSVVFASLLILTISVRTMSFFCMLMERKGKREHGKGEHHAGI